MKRLIFLLIILFIPTLLFSEKVSFDAKSQKLIISEVYIQDHPELCYHLELNLESSPTSPYGVALAIDLKSLYQINGMCDTSADTPYFNGVTGNLIIPELFLNGKAYVVNLKFNTQISKFLIEEIKLKNSVNYGNEELIGYCGYTINGSFPSCLELYYIEGNIDKEDVVKTAEQYCKYMNSQLVKEHCPIFQDFTYACKIKIQESLAQITYYKEIGSSYISAMKSACESGGGEFLLP